MRKFILTVFAASFIFTSCYSVFSGGTGGRVVDAESTSATKTGISDADVYAYTSQAARDSDFSAWNETTRFAPTAPYYAHTISGSDGSFSLSKIIWKSNKSKFGKDADYSKIFLLFYHENYGLVKGDTLIVSDSTSNTVYQEMTKIRKTTALNINLTDVATDSATSSNILVTVSVPQTTETLSSIPAKVYKANISGTGRLEISYPRWQKDEDKSSGKETSPELTITYKMSGDEETWKACYHKDNEDKNFAFFDSSAKPVIKTVSGDSYDITLYGKRTSLSVPSVSGTTTLGDGVVISMKGSADSGTTYSMDFGEVTTHAQTVGTSATQTHGNFENLGNGYSWKDTAYTDRYSEIPVKIYADGNAVLSKTLRSDVTNVNVVLP